MALRQQNRRLGGSAKEAIRDAAAALFAEKGYAATSTREICGRAGVTKPVLYYHFGNKGQLYEEVFLETFNEYQKELRRAARRAKTPRERLTNVLSAMFAFVRRRHNYWRLGFRMVFAPEKESPTIDCVEMSQSDERLLAEIVREGIRRKLMKGRPDFIAGAIVGMAISSILGYLLTGKPPLDRALARNIIDLITNGCGVYSTHR
jgi:TetR/AcrR family transcriptional regulator